MADISEIKVNEKLLAKLKNMPEEMKKQVRLTMESVVFECERVVKQKLSGPVLHRRSSRLYTSIGSQVTGSGNDTVGRFGVTKHPGGKPVRYARIHELGGTIHMPPRSSVVAFTKAGKFMSHKQAKRKRGGAISVWAGRVKGYDIVIPKRSYIDSTAKEKKSWIVGRFHSMLTNMGNNLGK